MIRIAKRYPGKRVEPNVSRREYMSDPAVHAPAAAIEIPCGAGYHWRRIRTFLPIDPKNLDLDLLRSRVGKVEPGWRLLLAESEQSECHTHVRFDRVESADDDDGQQLVSKDFFILEIDTIRQAVSEAHGQTSFQPHSHFLSALGESLRDIDRLPIAVSVDLYYPVDQTKWKAALLTESLEFGEFDQDLGSISLAGLILEFQDSRVGLRRVTLDTSPLEDEYLVSLSYGHPIPVLALTSMYKEVLGKAEEFASLFVSLRAK